MRPLTLVALAMAMCVIVRVSCRPPPDGCDPTGPDSELDAGPHPHRPRAWISAESKRHPCRACLRCTSVQFASLPLLLGMLQHCGCALAISQMSPMKGLTGGCCPKPLVSATAVQRRTCCKAAQNRSGSQPSNWQHATPRPILRCPDGLAVPTPVEAGAWQLAGVCLLGEGGGTPLGCAIAHLPPCSFHVDPIRGQLPHHLLQARLGRHQWRQPRPGAVCPEGCCGCKRLWCVGAPTMSLEGAAADPRGSGPEMHQRVACAAFSAP